MRFSVRLSSIRKIFRWIKRIFVVGLILAIGYGGYWLYHDINRVWNDPNTWVNPYIKLPKKIDHLKIYIKKDPVKKTIEYKIDYALLYDIKEEGDFLVYKFSLMPWIFARTDVVSQQDVREKFSPDIELRVPKSKPPLRFLGREVINENSFKTLSPDRLFIPVSFSVRLRVSSKDDSLVHRVLVYLKLKLYNQHPVLPYSFVSWLADELETEYAHKESDYWIQYGHSWSKDVMRWVLIQLNAEEGLYKNPTRFWRRVQEFFSHYYYTCNLKEGCQQMDNNVANPAPGFVYFVYALYRYDRETFDKLYSQMREQFSNFGLGGKYDKSWTFISPYTFVVYPWLDREDKVLKEVFRNVARPVKAPSQIDCSPLDELKTLARKQEVTWNAAGSPRLFSTLNLVLYEGAARAGDSCFSKASAYLKLPPVERLGYQIYVTTRLTPYRFPLLYLPRNVITLTNGVVTDANGVFRTYDIITSMFFSYALQDR